jgi:hypothetical protein
MNRLIVTAALAASAVSPLAAQLPAERLLEVRPFAGALIPVRAHRDAFLTAPMAGLQAAVEVRPTFHVLATFAWSAAQDKFGLAQNNVNVYSYNVGAELGLVRQLVFGRPGDWELRPFVGAGVGARSYQYRAFGMSDRTCFAGYGALGTELQHGNIALRFEGRGNAFCFRSPLPGVESQTRGDVGLSLGMAWHIH